MQNMNYLQMSEKMHLCGRRVDDTEIARMTLV